MRTEASGRRTMLLTREHVQRIVNEKAATPFAQRNFLNTLRAVFKWAAKDRGMTFGNTLMTPSYFGFKLPPARWSPRRDRRGTLYRRGRSTIS